VQSLHIAAGQSTQVNERANPAFTR
jgi:hypothetical protein